MARVVTVSEGLRAALAEALENSGLSRTSKELGLSYPVVQALVDGNRQKFRLERVATFCLNLHIPPERLEELGYPPVAAEMRRIIDRQLRANASENAYNAAVQRAMGRNDE